MFMLCKFNVSCRSIKSFLFFRILDFYVEDDQDAANVMNSTLELTIIAVNDAPILLFVSDPAVRESPTPVLSGTTQMSFTYTEDDPPLNFGRDIYLRDVDSNISLAVLNLTSKTNVVHPLLKSST